ncbi:MAG: helix-turn-helix domain-containing protein [Mediterraneibacter gnavus]
MMMVKVSEIISNNIMNIMKQNGKKQIDLADYLGVSKQVISKMLTGGRMINAIELQKISEFLGTSMDNLVKRPEVLQETNAIKAFMGKVETQEAKNGLEIADEIANLICFYARTRENAKEMMESWEA